MAVTGLLVITLFLPAFSQPHKLIVSRKSETKAIGIVTSEFSIYPIRGLAFWHNSPHFMKHAGSRQLSYENADHSLTILRIPKKRSWHFLWFWQEEFLMDAAYFEGIGNINLFSFLDKTQPELKIRADAAISAYKQALEFQPQNRSLLLFRIGQAYVFSGRDSEAIQSLKKSLACSNASERAVFLEFIHSKGLSSDF
ncbi:MAG: tetratricopeptide repeat protein [Armatimonas sp.]